MRKFFGQAPTAGEQTQQKPCRMFSDIEAELENRIVGRCPFVESEGVKKKLSRNEVKSDENEKCR
jgi:hypothetical protein